MILIRIQRDLLFSLYNGLSPSLIHLFIKFGMFNALFRIFFWAEVDTVFLWLLQQCHLHFVKVTLTVISLLILFLDPQHWDRSGGKIVNFLELTVDFIRKASWLVIVFKGVYNLVLIDILEHLKTPPFACSTSHCCVLTVNAHD